MMLDAVQSLLEIIVICCCVNNIINNIFDAGNAYLRNQKLIHKLRGKCPPINYYYRIDQIVFVFRHIDKDIDKDIRVRHNRVDYVVVFTDSNRWAFPVRYEQDLR